MQDRGGMLPLPLLADDGRLAIALDRMGRDPKRRHGPFAEQAAQLLADGHQRLQILGIEPGEGVLDHRRRHRLARRRIDGPAHLAPRFLDRDHDLADLGLHLSPSSPLISEARRPPTRAWMRGPVVITRARTSSSAWGASASPTSMASKWLRT